MNRISVLTVFIILCSIHTYSQSDTLNQFDSEGKKKGWWITYLDENLKILKDSAGATHCMYNYYTGKIYHYRYGNRLGSRKYPVHFPKNNDMKIGDYKLLNGDYITKYKNGTTQSKLSALNGILIDFKYYYPDGQLKVDVIYSTECGAPITHCIREYNKDGSLKHDSHGWFPKETLEATSHNTPCSDTLIVESGVLDGKSYLIEVKQESGKEHQPRGGWPMDTLNFNSGKMFSVYMLERERFCPSKYSQSSNQKEEDSLTNFKYENYNPGGSFLTISGTVQESGIKGTISWTSAAQNITRTYTFEGSSL